MKRRTDPLDFLNPNSKYEASLGEKVAVWVLYPPRWWLEGAIVSTLWGWFVVPLGAVPIGKMQGVGLVVLASLPLLGLASIMQRDNTTPPLARSLASIVGWLVSFGVGALAHYLGGL